MPMVDGFVKKWFSYAEVNMKETVDTSAAFLRFAPFVPRTLARDLLIEQGVASHEPREVARSLPAATAFLRGIAAEHGIDRRVVELSIKKMQEPFDPEEIDDAHVEDTCRQLAVLWLKALDETRDLVEADDPIALTDELLPDGSSIHGEEDVGELVEAVRETISSMCAVLSVDRVWRLYGAFVASVRTEMTDVMERIDLSETTVLVVTNGAFSLEKRTH